MKILFINSVCTRNGSTLMLLYFLEWLKKEHPDYQIDVISKSGGSVSSDFDHVAGNHIKLFQPKNLFQRTIRATLRKLKIIKLYENALYDYEIKALKKKRYDLIYNNTIFNLKLSNLLKDKCDIPKMILHVHELNDFIKSVYKNFENLLTEIDLFIAVSTAVRNNLTENWGIKHVHLVHAFTKLNLGVQRKVPPSSNIVISGSGRGAKTKGLDYFIETCHFLSKYFGDDHVSIKYQWLGHLTQKEKIYHQKLVQKYSLDSYFYFIEEKEDTQDFYKNTTVFLMSSREDSFPLVCVEAAMHGIPIFVFDGATGTQEVFEDLNYLIAPKFDTKIMATKINNLLNDKMLYSETSKILNERFVKFDVETQSEELFKILSIYA